MSNPGDSDATPATSLAQLAAHVAEGCKPPDRFRIGTEHEKFGVRADQSPPAYEGADGIRAVLRGMAGVPIADDGALIGLKQELLAGVSAAISLEPAGQLELSGGPVRTLHETAAELAAHLDEVRAVADPLGVHFVPLGFHPLATREDMPWMPKRRYAIMRGHMPRVGSMGLDMMTRTCTVQVNLDYASEADMRRKLRVGLALQPLATALFASSPFVEGRDSGFVSYRAHVWTDVDRARTGVPAPMMEDGFGFERFAHWAVHDLPMYFVVRDGAYVDLTGRSFADLMAGKIAGLEATVGDFADHITTAFTDVRLKRFLEMRGSDAGSPGMMVAQSAFWVGLLYDQAALDAVWALVGNATADGVMATRAAVPRFGLDASADGLGHPGRLRDLLGPVMAIAADGLRARSRAGLRDESAFLDPLHAIAAGGPTQAEALRSRFVAEGGRSVAFALDATERYSPRR